MTVVRPWPSVRLLPAAFFLCALLSLLAAPLRSQGTTFLWEVADTTGSRYYFDNALASDGVNDFVLISDGVGSSPHVLRSSDAGVTWNVLDGVGDYPMERWNTVAHPTPEVILISGHLREVVGFDPETFNSIDRYRGVGYFSTNGGGSWLTLYTDTNLRLLAASMADANNAIVVVQTTGNGYNTVPNSYPDSLFVTHDAWKTYRTVVLPAEISYATQSFCFDEDTWYVYAYSGVEERFLLFRTENGGLTWEKGGEVPQGVGKIRFTDPMNGWGCGGRSNGVGHQQRDLIARTTDGGATWSIMLDELRGQLPFGLRDVAFAGTSEGIAVGGANKILRTRDGGVTWAQEFMPEDLQDESSGINHIAFPRADLAVAVSGTGPIIRYTGRATLAAPLFIRPTLPGPHPVESVTVEWSRIDGATSYRVQAVGQPIDDWFYDPALWDQRTVDTVLSATTLELTGLEHRYRYYVRVKAIGGTAESDWYANELEALFYTADPALPVPAILVPPDNAIDVPISLEIEWQGLDGAQSYDLRVDRVANGQPIDITIDTTGLTVPRLAVAGLDPATTYHVRVRAHYASGVSDWTTGIHSFRTTGSSAIISSGFSTGSWSLSPNPARDGLSLIYTGRGLAGRTEVTLLDPLGRELRRLTLEDGDATVALPVEDLSAGAYFIRIVDEVSTTVHPFRIVR